MPIIFCKHTNVSYTRLFLLNKCTLQNKYFDVLIAFIILSLRNGPDLSCVVTEHFQIYYMLFIMLLTITLHSSFKL